MAQAGYKYQLSHGSGVYKYHLGMGPKLDLYTPKPFPAGFIYHKAIPNWIYIHQGMVTPLDLYKSCLVWFKLDIYTSLGHGSAGI